MKKIMLIMSLLFICNFVSSYSKTVHHLKTVTNKSYSKNVGVRPAGMDQYTYGYVNTNKNESANDIYYQTYCLDPGDKNCRTEMSIKNEDIPLDDKGNQMFDSEYLSRRIDYIESTITNQIDTSEPGTGYTSFNEIYNGYYIYQNANWTVNEDASYSFTITFGVNE